MTTAPRFTGNILIDTRERNRRAIESVTREWGAITGGGVCERGLGLSGGDYALEVEEGAVGSGQFVAWPEARVEGKWMGDRGPGDFFQTVTQDRDRFARELARLESQHPYSMVLIEGKHSDIRAHHTPSGMSWAGGVSEAVLTLATRHRVPWLFSERAPLALSMFMYRAARNDELERLALDIPRPVIVCEDLERLALVIESAEPIIRGAQFVVGESAPSDPQALAIICDDMQRAAAGFWFLDGDVDLEAFAARFRFLEARETAMRAAGGIPAAPASYAGPLPTWDTWKAPVARRHKRGLVIAFDGHEDGSRALILRCLARGAGSAIEILQAPALVASITRLADADALPVLAMVEDPNMPERDLLPRVVARCRELWAGGAADPVPPPAPIVVQTTLRDMLTGEESPGNTFTIPPREVVTPKLGRPGNCRSCDALVWWGKTAKGKACPFDADGGSHFGTCPQAAGWTKREEPIEAAPAPTTSPQNEENSPAHTMHKTHKTHTGPVLLDAIHMLTAALDRALTQTIPYPKEVPPMAQNNDTNALAIRAGMPLAELGMMLARSGLFGVHSDPAKGQAQAVVKVMFGKELGIAPIAAMTGIHVIEGKPSVGANLIARAIKKSARYDYRVLRQDHEGCDVVFLERPATELGRYSFTMKDAQAAGLANKANWKAHPRSMLFARCIGQGYRIYCPDVFDIEVYAEGELEPQPDPEPQFIAARLVYQAPTGAEPNERYVDAPDNAGAAAGGGVDSPAAAPVESLPPATAAEEAAYIESKQPDVDHKAVARRKAVSQVFVDLNIALVVEEGLVQQVFGGSSAATWSPSEQDADEAMGAARVIGALLRVGLSIEEACPLWAGAVDENGQRITLADAERFAADLTPRLLNLVERSGSQRIANLDRVALRSECEDALKSMCSAVPF